jgi:hypothetical protein
VAFDLEIDDPVAEYLDGLELSDHGRAVVAHALGLIATVPDAHRLAPENRVGPNLFRCAHIFRDLDGRVHAVAFVVDDHAAAQGVLQVRFAEHVVREDGP